MSRTASRSTSSRIPARSRIVRKTVTAPRRATLRIVEAPRGVEADGDAASDDAAQRRAFAAACLPHQAELFGVAVRICRDPDAAKDLVQDTLMRAMCAWSSFLAG